MPEPSPNEQFQRVLEIAENQIRESKILIRFGPTGKLRFVIDEASVEKALGGSNMDDKTFRQIFHNEIGPLLEAVVQDRVEQHLTSPSPLLGEIGGDPSTLEPRRELLRKRANLIEQRIFNPELRARYLIKVSSKHPRLRTSSWEVAKKIQLSTKQEAFYPYATLNLETIQPEMDLGFFSWMALLAPEFGRSENVAFDCDEGDLDDLIQILQDAKTALHNARKGA